MLVVFTYTFISFESTQKGHSHFFSLSLSLALFFPVARMRGYNPLNDTNWFGRLSNDTGGRSQNVNWILAALEMSTQAPEHRRYGYELPLAKLARKCFLAGCLHGKKLLVVNVKKVIMNLKTALLFKFGRSFQLDNVVYDSDENVSDFESDR